MATNPSRVTLTISGSPPTATCTPDPVEVVKGTNDGVQWTLDNDDFVFTSVTIDSVTITPSSGPSGDFSGVTIDNSAGNNTQSVMTVNDSLAEIIGNVHSDDHAYSLNYQARSGGQTHSYDPTIRNHD